MGRHGGILWRTPYATAAILAITGRQRLGNLEKKSQITTGDSKASPASGMACPPFCTEYKMTTAVLSFTQVMLSTELRPALCGSVAIRGGAVTPNSFAQYLQCLRWRARCRALRCP